MKKPKKTISFVEAYKSIRKKWTIKPVTKVKGNAKKEASKKACRKGKDDGQL